MHKLALTVVAAAALWLFAPATEARADVVEAYVCRVNFNAVSGGATYQLYSGPACTGTSLGTFYQELDIEPAAAERLLGVLTSAAASGTRLTVTYRRVYFGAYLHFIQNVVLHAG